jgi:hypothetical protein
MFKFRVFDNIGFSFGYTKNNIGDFLVLRKKLFLSILVSILLLIVSSYVLSNPIRTYILPNMDMMESLTNQQEDLYFKNPNIFIQQDGSLILNPDDSDQSVLEYKKISMEIDILIDNSKEVFIQNWVSFASFSILFLLLSFLILVVSYEWIRYSFEEYKDIKLGRNLLVLIKMFFYYMFYMFLPVILISCLLFLTFFMPRIITFIFITILVIALIYFMFVMSVALKLKMVEIVLQRKENSVISLFKQVKGNVLRFLTAAFIIGLTFNVLVYLVDLLSDSINLFIPIVITLLTVIYILHYMVSYSLLCSFYKGSVKNDQRFLK